MYQGITTKDSILLKNRETGAELYDVTVESFEEHLQWLHDNDYFTERPKLDSSSISVKKKVTLTFDDGEMNNFTHALNVLQKFEYSAYFFIIGEKIGKPGYMGWKELGKLHEAGMTLGSHGLSHEILTNLLDTQIEEELLASKKYLERNLNITVNSLSIPHGFCNEKIIRMAYETGYSKIFVSNKPINIQSSYLERIAVKNTWDLKRFQQALEGKIPFKEKVSAMIKSPAKIILRERGYNAVRSLLIKIIN
ncbi:hypothetical protein MNBD_UNCLBAC01-930 [hydrothermal vent metagenome]|uniref:NodB homology domain-containing protein n=1 Tax=hydrothermal vent metagenome TaxID=652676 RepID=A0A3B1DMT8_9ZZZZ